MLIDWFTVVAQAVNFLILVWLLKRFLYRPVLAAIDAREQKIATQLAQATQREAQAQTEREEFQRRNETLAREREAILRKASDAVDAERQTLLEAARQDDHFDPVERDMIEKLLDDNQFRRLVFYCVGAGLGVSQ